MPKLISGRSALVDSRGSILQVVKTTNSSAVTMTTFQSYEEIDNLTLITKGTNSSFLVMGTAHAFHSQSTTRVSIGFQIGSTFIAGKTGNPGDAWGHDVGGLGGHINRHIVTDQTYAAGTSLTFKMLGAQWDNRVTGTPSVFVGAIFNYGSNVSQDYGHVSALTVMEIANQERQT